MPTAAAKRAEEAEKQRLQNNAAEADKAAKREYMRKYRQEHAEELKAKRRVKYAESKAAEEDSISLDPFPADSLIAAAVGQKHHLTVVEAEGRTQNGDRIVIVENLYIDGVRYHRVKRTQYTYHRSRKAAIAAAQKENVKLILYCNNN